MKGTELQLIEALQPLKEHKKQAGQLKYNCPRCENELNYARDKFNLEVSYSQEIFHCWSCHLRGHISKLIKLYGNKHYLDLFKPSNHITLEEPEDENKTLCLPSYCVSVFLYPEVLNYLLERGLTKQLIKEREIVYCTKDYYKNHIIFPSYSSKNQLVSFVAKDFTTGKYKMRKLHSEFVCFYEKFIDKRIKIIVTEGCFDCLVIPNAVPLLGTSISNRLLNFLTGCKVILAVDNDREEIEIVRMIKALKKICDSVEVFKYSKCYEDINDFHVKNKTGLVQSLKNYYI